MTIDSSGNVGIGASSPGSKLEVSSGYIISGTVSATGGPKILGGYYSSGNITTLGSEYSNGGPVLGYGVWPSTAAASAFVSSTAINASRGAYTIVGNNHVWYGGGAQTVAIDSPVTTTELMRIDSSGNLGVGETSPSARLHVKTSSSSISVFDSTETNGGYLTFSRSGTAKGYIGSPYHLTIPNGSNDDFAVRAVNNLIFVTGTTERARIDSSGNVGIGVVPNTWTAAWRAIELATSGSSVFSNGASSVGLGQGFYNNSGSKYAQASYAVGGYQINAGSHQFLIAAAGTVGAAVSFTTAMTLDASGNLLVGTTASAGDITNTAPVVAGVFKTLSGTVSAATATATTIATLPNVTNGTYIVSCGLAAGDPTNYSAVSLVTVDATVLRITNLQTAALMSITVSGQTVRATQISGITNTIFFTLTRVS